MANEYEIKGEKNDLLEVNIGRQLKPGEKMQFNAGTTLEYSNAYDFKIIKK